VALAILSKEPVFAVDHEFSERWWVRPFIKLTSARPLDPARPLATRTVVQAVKNGDTLVIFPEGRITRNWPPVEGL
jgi:acyl-[acyl-carrier-protein]-phospholipid O-acyltransferase / long-chain-fatty-acid--[acyl-carrier-protein] ligase